jgi:hypothetical protein
VHADDLESKADHFAALILPNLGSVSDRQAQALRAFVERGGGLLATGHSTLFDESGTARADFGLADIFGAHVQTGSNVPDEPTRRKRAADTYHTYLRLLPEWRAGMDGPHKTGEPSSRGPRHLVLRGFEQTDLLPFGGLLEPLRLEKDTQVLATFVPQFPIYPPETAWMREPKTDIPGVIVRVLPAGGRVAFLPADIDRRFARDNLPDHGDLVQNLVRWIARDNIPLSVSGPGLVDCHLYSQSDRAILQLVNLTNAGTWRQPVHELIPIGPLRIRVKLWPSLKGKTLRLLVSDQRIPLARKDSWGEFTLPSLLDHELAVLT